MLSMDIWQRVRHLGAQKWSKRAIAQELGVSRNTVARALAEDGPPRYEREGRQGAALDSWRTQVETGLRRGLSGVRLLAEVRTAGYRGSDATFYRWLAGLKAAQKEVAACRFETDPGEQAQFDWSPYTVRLGGQVTRLIVYSLLCAYSRRVHWFPSLSDKQAAVFEGLEEGWLHFGGACRFLVVDNARAFVSGRRGAQVEWNQNFLRLCGHYSVQPIASTPGHPQGKGKVENPFRWLESQFLQGREWRDLNHLQAELAVHEGEWERRVHGTTKSTPLARFAEEQRCLLSLPASRFLQWEETFRQVSRDCLISYEAVHYSVPWPYAGKSVVVRTSQGRVLLIYATSGKEIARHELRARGTPPVFDPQHYQGLRWRHGVTLATLVPRFHERYVAQSETAKRFLERLLASHRHHPDRALADALGLLTAVPDSVALAAMATAVEFNLCTLPFLEEQLRRLSTGTPPALSPPPPLGQLPLPDLHVERSLEGYASAIQSS